MQKKFKITGMTCSACSSRVEKIVKQLSGVNKVNVNLLQNTMLADFDSEVISPEEIMQAVEAGGYGASLYGGEKKLSAVNEENPLREMKYRLIISFIFLIPLMYLSMGHMSGWPVPHFFHGAENSLNLAFTQFLLTLPIMYVNSKYYQVGFKALFSKAPNMDTLIAIGSSAAVLYGIFALYNIGYGLGHGDLDLVKRYSMDLYFESAAMILTLITVGKYLETRSKGKTSEAISKLLDLSPKKALVVRGDEQVELPLEEVRIGDIVIVKSGQMVPLDGIITEGEGLIDESALTGESMPIEKKVNDHVTGATLNKAGYFRMEVLRTGEDTTIAKIIKLVEEAGSSKAPIAKLADQVSGIFVPVVLLLALLAALVWLFLGYSFEFALTIGIAVLVISCPCALGLATPTAIMVGTGKGAEQGILIKSAESLEIAHKINTVVLDKTGTVTEGKPKVTDIIGLDGKRQMLNLAASLEALSEHPLAEAVVEKAEEEKLSLFPTHNFKAIAGQGISGEIAGQQVLAGNLRMMQEFNIPLSGYEAEGQKLARQGKTPLYISADGKLLGIIAVADVLKPSSRQAVANLQAMQIEVVMLTGDNQETAEYIRQQAGVDRAVAELLPQDKEREIRKMQEQGKIVAMIGDGINDAPALARADVGVAIGAGTDIAIDSADFVLMKSDLMDAVTAIQLSHAVIKNIKENLFWAFFYNALGIPLAAGVFYHLLGWRLNPMFAAAAMSLSSVCVVSNALRLKLFQPKAIGSTPEQSNKKEGKQMKKTITIEGMSCSHCTRAVEKALSRIDGVAEVKVDLAGKKAEVELSQAVADDILQAAVENEDFQVTDIQ